MRTDLIDLFLGHANAEEKMDNTLIQYGGVLDRFDDWLREKHKTSLESKDISAVSGVMLTEYYQLLHSRELSVATRNNYTVAIRRFFSFLMDAQVISTDPSKVLHSVREKKKPDDPGKMETSEQIADLMKLLEGQTERNSIRDVAMVALILGSGMRASELCSLNVSDLNGIRDGVVTIRRKGGNVENVYIADFAYNYVLRYVVMRGKTSPDEPLFLSQKGNRMNRNTLWKSLASKQRLIEQHTGIHRFRHAFISDVEHNQKGGAALARDLGGHKSVRITNTYLHTTEEERKEAVDHMGYAEVMAW